MKIYYILLNNTITHQLFFSSLIPFNWKIQFCLYDEPEYFSLVEPITDNNLVKHYSHLVQVPFYQNKEFKKFTVIQNSENTFLNHDIQNTPDEYSYILSKLKDCGIIYLSGNWLLVQLEQLNQYSTKLI